MKHIVPVLLLSLFGWHGAFAQCDGASANISVQGQNNFDGEYYQTCIGNELQFNTSGTILPNGDEVATILWNMQGATFTTESATATFTIPSIYSIILTITTEGGCTLLDTALIALSPEPTFSLHGPGDMCSNDSIWITGSVYSTTISSGQAFWNFETQQIEDSGPSTIVEIDVAGVGQETIEDCSDFEYIMLNMEHSYMGDLVITLTCPSGVAITLHGQGGGGTYLGEPIDNVTDPWEPGIGYNYYWSPADGLLTWAESAGFGTLESGYYAASGDLCDFVGCPINGTWTISATDLVGADDGGIFHSAISFFTDSGASYQYTQTFGASVDSTYWLGPGILEWADEGDSALVAGLSEDDYDYLFIAIGSSGCTYTGNMELEVIDPEIPEIDQDGENLECTDASAYQWYLNGQLIEEANNQVYTPIENGTYTVAVYDENLCAAVSEPLVYTTISESAYHNSNWMISPNPCSDRITIQSKRSIHPSSIFIITDMTGRKVCEQKITSESFILEIDVSDFESGIYQLQQWTDSDILQVNQIVKQ